MYPTVVDIEAPTLPATSRGQAEQIVSAVHGVIQTIPKHAGIRVWLHDGLSLSPDLLSWLSKLAPLEDLQLVRSVEATSKRRSFIQLRMQGEEAANDSVAAL